MKLLLNSPIWYIFLCIAIGVLGAFLLYRKDKSLSELSVSWKRILASLRFLTISMLAFLLLEPLLEFSKEKIEKPILVIANDSSQSMVFSKDSAQVKQELKDGLQLLETELANKYEIVTYNFGNELEEGFNFEYQSKSTDFSRFFKEIENRYYNRNLSGIILATDGIYNSGSNPLFEAKKLKNIPVFTIAVGDTTVKKDVFIDQISHNRLVYRGNKFPVIVEIKAEQCKGKSAMVKITKGAKVLAQKPISFSVNDDLKQVQFELMAEGNGLQKYSVSVSEVEGEFSSSNNYKSFYIDVLESKEKILLLANSPHPDVNAIKLALQSNENYEVTTELVSSFKGKVDKYNLVVAFNLPSNKNKLEESTVPALYFLGNQTDFKKFNTLKKGVEVQNSKGFTDAQTYFNPNFSSFKISTELNSFVSSLSPLQVPFTTKYDLANSAEEVLFQKIGPVKTTYPLLAFNKKNNTKYGFFIGEGVWRWKLQDYALNENNDRFNELFTQSAQFLISKEDKSLFRVFGENTYDDNDKVKFESEIYNSNYELVNTNEVNMKIVNEQNEEFTYQFSQVGDRYGLEAGVLPPGNYKYIASTRIKGKNTVRNGEFSVNEMKLEQNNSKANHQLLFNISDVTGGKMVNLSEVNSLSNFILENGEASEVIFQEKDIDDLINIKTIFFLLLGLLGIEWFVRKRNGGY
ncbi:MAG: hypothetical protein ABF242_06355 [Flavobacteriales bacterium]